MSRTEGRSGPGPARPCARCHHTRPHQGRGLCHSCHKSVTLNGRLNDYPEQKVDRVALVAPHLADGMSYQQIADLLGCTKNAVAMAARRIQRTPRDEVEAAWFLTPAPEAPDTVPCAEAAGLFDIECHSRNIINKRGQLATWVTPQIDAALAYCARCPLATREWCVNDAAQPHKSGAAMVAGAAVWINRRQVWSLDDHEARHEAGAVA